MYGGDVVRILAGRQIAPHRSSRDIIADARWRGECIEEAAGNRTSGITSSEGNQLNAMRIHFLFGTETGTAEYLCDDMSDSIADRFECDVTSMDKVDPADLDRETLYILVTSTFGSGDLPGTAVPFYNTLEERKPDLTDVRFAIFGLGDQTFGETYNNGSKRLMEQMLACKATMIGERGLYDGAAQGAPEDDGLPWLDTILEELAAA